MDSSINHDKGISVKSSFSEFSESSDDSDSSESNEKNLV